MGTEMGGLARVLAVTKPGGTMLCLGPGARAVAAQILGGMDLASRLVAVVPVGDMETDGTAPDPTEDLRFTVHPQASAAFLEDVSGHRFDLIVDLEDAGVRDVTALCLRRLAPGGIYLTGRSQTLDWAGWSLPAGEFTSARPSPGTDLLVVARHRESHPARRRGGRRARQSVTPMFSSRPRRVVKKGGADK